MATGVGSGHVFDGRIYRGAAGVAGEKLQVLPNGVDLKEVRPSPDDRAEGRDPAQDLRLLSVGHLLPDKGHHLAIEALRRLPGARLTIVGTADRPKSFRSVTRADCCN